MTVSCYTAAFGSVVYDIVAIVIIELYYIAWSYSRNHACNILCYFELRTIEFRLYFLKILGNFIKAFCFLHKESDSKTATDLSGFCTGSYLKCGCAISQSQVLQTKGHSDLASTVPSYQLSFGHENEK